MMTALYVAAGFVLFFAGFMLVAILAAASRADDEAERWHDRFDPYEDEFR